MKWRLLDLAERMQRSAIDAKKFASDEFENDPLTSGIWDAIADHRYRQALQLLLMAESYQ